MAISAARTGRQPKRAGQNGAAAPQVDRRRAFRRARLHTVLVRLCKVLFPACALASFGFYAFDPGNKLAISVGGLTGAVEISSKDLRMVNPQYDGYTADNAHYVVAAATAIQQFGKPDDVGLEKIDAKLEQPDGSTAHLVATSGHFQTKTEVLKLFAGVTVTTSSGMKAELAAADIFFKDKRLVSASPVQIIMPNGTVKAIGLEMLGEAKRVKFLADVTAHLVPRQTAATPLAAGAAAALMQSDGPIDINAATLEIDDVGKTATFAGGVTALQPEATLTAKVMKVTYSGNATPETAGGGVGADIISIEARDTVKIISRDGRTVSGEFTHFDRAAQTVRLTGNVVVQEAGNMLRGDQIQMDLVKRHTRVSGPGRVFGRFAPAAGGAGKGKNKSQTASADAVPGDSGLAGLSSGSGPTDVEADQLDVYEDKGLAVFRGKVLAHRGDQQISAGVLEVGFTPGATAAGAGGQRGSQLTRMVARDRVSVKAPNGQVATSDHMLYEAKSELITLTGNVIVSRDQNVVKGDKLVIDLKTGQSRFITDDQTVADGSGQQTTKKGRIRMLITQDGMKLLEPGQEAGEAGTGAPEQAPAQSSASPALHKNKTTQ